MLHWTDDALYWVAKPKVYLDPATDVRRLHRADGPALDSDVEPLYFWHGVLVPEHAVMRPADITVSEIQAEENAEVRRVLIERFGEDRFIQEIGALPVHADDCGTLYRVELANDEPLTLVRVLNSTPEADGSQKPYWIRVPPDMTEARQAVAWSFGLSGPDYQPAIET